MSRGFFQFGPEGSPPGVSPGWRCCRPDTGSSTPRRPADADSMRRMPAVLWVLALLGVAKAPAAADATSVAGDEANAKRRAEAYYAMVRKAPRQDEILDLLHRGDFAVLEKKLEALQAGYEAGKTHEYFVYAAFESFSRPHVEPEVQRWATEHPGSWPALAARGVMYWAAASRARGTKVISKTLPQQLQEMEKNLHLSAQDFRAVVAARPRFLPAYVYLIVAARMAGDTALGSAALHAALQQDPKSFVVRDSYMVALTPMWGGSTEAMEAFAREAQAQAGANPELIGLLGYSYASQAEDSLRRHDSDRAIALYTQALRYVRWPAWLSSRAKAYEESGRYEEALADVAEALRYTPDGASVLVERARCLRDMGKRDAALQDYARAAELVPNSPWIVHEYAKALESVEPLERASLYERYLAANPDAAEMIDGLGELYLQRLQQPERARDLFAREVEVAPERLSGWRNYGDALHRLHDPRAKAVYAHYFELVDRSSDSDPMDRAERLMAQAVRRNLALEAEHEGSPQ